MKWNEALRLCNHWLPLWTGNQPDELIKVYSPNAFYRDPACPAGIQGRDALLKYLRKLLAAFPDWVWKSEDIFPVENGFVLRWSATIPVNRTTIRETGMDLVIVENDMVTRNEVYFDRTALLTAMNRRD